MPAKTPTQPAAARKTTTARAVPAARTAARTAKTAVPAATFTAPTQHTPEADSTAVPVPVAELAPARLVDGVAVVKDEPELSPLSAHYGKLIPLRTRRVLTLADGRTVIGCADCQFTGTRGEVRSHRYDEHGDARPKRGLKVIADGPPDPVDAEPDESVLPANVASMTVGEVFTLVAHVGQWEILLDAKNEQIARLAAELAAARKTIGRWQKQLAKVGFVLKEEADAEDGH